MNITSKHFDARESVRTALLCASMVALGFFLGVNIFTAEMITTLDLGTYSKFNESAASLNAFYHTVVRYSLGTFFVASLGVAALDSGLVWTSSEN